MKAEQMMKTEQVKKLTFLWSSLQSAFKENQKITMYFK